MVNIRIPITGYDIECFKNVVFNGSTHTWEFTDDMDNEYVVELVQDDLAGISVEVNDA